MHKNKLCHREKPEYNLRVINNFHGRLGIAVERNFEAAIRVLQWKDLQMATVVDVTGQPTASASVPPADKRRPPHSRWTPRNVLKWSFDWTLTILAVFGLIAFLVWAGVDLYRFVEYLLYGIPRCG